MGARLAQIMVTKMLDLKPEALAELELVDTY
jgi:hypothetical protein